MKKLYLNYLDSFKGLSPEVWWLALITLINRAGTMVIPFLSLYLKEDLDFSPENVGAVMTCFGLGSLVGAWIGGKLTDLFGYYKIMVLSLVLTGLLFMSLQFLDGLWPVCLGVFILMIAADAFRPASYVALDAYSKLENRTRSITLIRLAINLGFSAGPALGGVIIAHMGYEGLFWTDGSTCVVAGILLLFILHPKKAKEIEVTKNTAPKSAYTDIPYLIFIFAMVLFGSAFVQYFSTVPIYYKDIHFLSEDRIGLLLAMNGFLIFALEMPLIKYLERKNWSKMLLIIFGFALVGLSFVILNLSSWTGVLLIGMLLMTLGEMIAFPFSNTLAMDRSKRGNLGEYMGLYSIAFATAHIFAHNGGMRSIANFGYIATWYGIGVLCLFSICLLLYLRKALNTKPRFK
ncbi:MDR family MFS transporter [Spongiimicrobium salis]|uniref:MDR family MFS transporter n=1 Tax=Spongiimicrobium salis TaxID=1667022 RepID=UPI00374DE6A6